MKKTKQQVPGIKTSEMPARIEAKIRQNYDVFLSAQGKEGAESIIKELTAAYVAEQDNSKVIATANRTYLDRITDDAGQQVAHHFNLRVHGALNAPNTKPKADAKQVASTDKQSGGSEDQGGGAANQ